MYDANTQVDRLFRNVLPQRSAEALWRARDETSIYLNCLMEPKSIDLDSLLTPAQFAQWIGESEGWVRRRLEFLPGVIREGRKHVRIHPRTYLEKRLRIKPS